MGYWSNQPMGGDFPEDIQINLRESLLDALNMELLEKFNIDYQELGIGIICGGNDINIDGYEKNLNEFTRWLQVQCINNEKIILKEISDIVICSNKADGYNCANLNDVCFIIPLSFLEWGIKLEPKSELSQYLLTWLKATAGGSKDRGYSITENMYPNSINNPSDFIKAYIDNWDDLISGNMNYSSIESTEEQKYLGGNLYNTR